MNWLDMLILVVLLGAAFGGMISGLIKSVFSLTGLVIGVMLAGRFSEALGNNLEFISSEKGAQVLAFIIIFLAVMIAATLMGIILTKLVSIALLGWVNRLAGAAFGFLLGGIFIAALLAVWVKYMSAGDTIINSAIAGFLLDGFPFILGLLPKDFDSIRQFFK